jgi:hypothetical protein
MRLTPARMLLESLAYVHALGASHAGGMTGRSLDRERFQALWAYARGELVDMIGHIGISEARDTSLGEPSKAALRRLEAMHGEYGAALVVVSIAGQAAEREWSAKRDWRGADVGNDPDERLAAFCASAALELSDMYQHAGHAFTRVKRRFF